MEKIEEVERFCNQVPKVLIDDITQSLGSQFLSNTVGVPEIKHRPSLCRTKRFHASLLFVDISGFTVLSQRLPVDEFKSHINNYFTKILDIVEKHEGDVVKFAGDALFIVWLSASESQDRADEVDGVEEQEARKVAMKMAVRCGVEILEKCSNYRIDFSHHHNTNFDSISSLVLSPIHREQQHGSSGGDDSHKDDHSFLNVHAGASEGVLVSMDIGHANRWEYFILGQPILDVADAEAVANKGELVISSSAHHMLCGGGITGNLDSINEERAGNVTANDNNNNDNECSPLADNTSTFPCGCYQTSNGCFLVNLASFSCASTGFHQHHSSKRASIKHRRQSGTENTMLGLQGGDDAEGDVMFPHYENMIVKVNYVFEVNKELMISEYKLLLGDDPTAAPMISPRSPRDGNNDHDLIADLLYAQFTHWAISCFSDDIARHVHEADRSSFQFVDLARQDQIKVLSNKKTSVTPAATATTPTSGGREAAGSFVARMRHLSRSSMELRGRSSSVHNVTTETSVHVTANGNSSGGRGLSGELRKVIVMFVNLKSSTHELTFDMHADITRDELLLSKFQSCIEVLVSALHESGGQLRQFIVDDKGTVAIGSFGLRGSSNLDNAATAVEAAQRIVDGLQLIGVDCGIGLTSGRAYCGLVGSTKRNEYAIMGPSTNLSARLMGKANMGEILCDQAIKESDRSHSFIAYGTVAAKGYAAPVAIFKPDINNRSESNDQDGEGRERVSRGHRNNIVIAPDSSKNNHDSSKTTISTDDPTATPSLLANIAILQAVAATETVNTPGNPNTTGSGGGRGMLNTATAATQALMIGGREYELQETYEFLAMSFVTSEEAREPFVEFLTNPLSIDMDHSLVFNEEHGLSSPTRMVIFEGESGIGKTTILRTVKRSFVRLSKRPEAAITIVHARSSSYRAWDPFTAIKTIIRKLLMRLATLRQQSSSFKFLTISDETKLTPHDRLVLEGIDYLSTLLTDDMKSLLPLMSFANIVKGIPENDATKHYEGELKLHKCEDLFISFINAFVDSMQTKVMIFFDDSQFMDNYTWRLVEKIWMECSGVIIITTFFARGEEIHTTRRRFTDSNEDNQERNTKNRILKIHLQSLPSEAVKNIAQGYFLARGLDAVDEEVYMKIDEFSGGNPLYVQEITKAIIDKSEVKIVEINDYQVIDTEKMAEQICSNENFFREILATFSSNYLEEIIYYRFDKLSIAQQMVLKVAAVISEDAGDFTFDYLLSIFEQNPGITDSLYANQQQSIKDNNSNGELRLDVLLAITLRDILELREFISNVDNSRRSSTSSLSSDGINIIAVHGIHNAISHEHKKKTDDDILLDMQHSTFAFKVPLERKAIEDLLLEEQKLLMHIQAGHWLSNRNQIKGEFATARDVHSEAQHWEQAKLWPQALIAYHKASMIVYRAGGTVDAIQIMSSSYRMLTFLQEEAGVTDRLDYGTLTFDIIYEQVQVEAERGFITHCPDGYWEKKLLMYKIFRGDATLLEETIDMVVHFGQMSAIHISNRDIVLRLYDFVMAIIILTRKRPNFPDDFKQTCPELENFGFKDYPSFFAVLNGYVIVARFSGCIDLKTERIIGNIILITAEMSSCASVETVYHKLPGWSILNSVAIAEGKLDEFVETGEAMIKVYQPKVHPSYLIGSYGSDMIPFAIARYGQQLWASGLFLRANAVMNYAVQHMKEVTHVMSLSKLAIFLTSLFTLQSRYTLAMSVFSHYVNTDDMLGGHSLYKIIHPLYFEWCTSKNKYGTPVTAYEPLCELTEQIAKGSYLASEQRARTMVFDALSMYGAGIEMPCADILCNKAMQWLDLVATNGAMPAEQREAILKEAEKILLVALDYTNRGLELYNNDVLYPTPYIGLRKLKLYTHHALDRCYTLMNETDKAKDSQLKAIQSIQLSIDMIKQLHFPFFLVIMGNYLNQEGIDPETGKQSIKTGLQRIVENNTKEDRIPALQFLTKALPQLACCVQKWLSEYEAEGASEEEKGNSGVIISDDAGSEGVITLIKE